MAQELIFTDPIEEVKLWEMFLNAFCIPDEFKDVTGAGIIEIFEHTFTFELVHEWYMYPPLPENKLDEWEPVEVWKFITYHSAGYKINESGNLEIDWNSVESIKHL